MNWPSSGPDAEKWIRAGIGPLCQKTPQTFAIWGDFPKKVNK